MLLVGWINQCLGAPFVIGKPLPRWQEGYLDIYHIHEGAGNSTFMIFPDGTTLLYDIGDVINPTNDKSSNSLSEYSPILPNASKSPYEWVAEFINQFSPHPKQLDYVVISHFHFDHMGEWRADRKEQLQGHYKLFGITGLADKIHIRTLIDRSYPDYNHHGDIASDLNRDLNSKNEYAKITALTMENYRQFLNYQKKQNGLNVEKFKVGSGSQIHLLYHPYPDFKVRNIIGNGYVWTGKDEGIYHFISYAENDQGNVKKENDLSNGIRIDYGSFRYFTGGDMTGRELTGNDIATSAESVAAPVIGKIDVATINHHGFNDAQSKIFVTTLRPSVWIQQNWAASQTSLPMLLRTLDPHSYNYHRDLFALHHFKINDLALPSLGKDDNQNPINQYYTNTMGHIVIRVLPGGKEYWVIMLSSDTENPVIKAYYGPYASTQK